VKTVRFIVLAAMLAVAGDASAVIRSPFPSRPSPPYQGRIFQIADSLTVTPRAVESAQAR
jgi:hypothetical protein